MKNIVAWFVVVGALPLFAQYGPPAKDLEDAQFFMQELRRQLEPALSEARDQAEVFTLISRVHHKLIGAEPASEVADALKMLDDYLERRGRGGRLLSRENHKTIISVRKELELQQPPYSVPALRERLHHEFVHNLERQALKNLKLIEKLETEWQFLTGRHMNPAKAEVMAGVTLTADDQ